MLVHVFLASCDAVSSAPPGQDLTFSLVGGSFTVLLPRLLVSCRLRVCLRLSQKPRQIPDNVMLVVGLVCS